MEIWDGPLSTANIWDTGNCPKLYCAVFRQPWSLSPSVLYQVITTNTLSSAETKKNVHKFNKESCIADDTVSFSLFVFLQLWQDLIYWVVIAKPAADLYRTWQQNNLIFAWWFLQERTRERTHTTKAWSKSFPQNETPRTKKLPLHVLPSEHTKSDGPRLS